jgi:cell cycle arrest protein BUB2
MAGTSEEEAAAAETRAMYEQLLAKSAGRTWDEKLAGVRRAVLQRGVPAQTADEQARVSSECSLRGRVWKALLGVRWVVADQYIQLVLRGPSRLADKIDRDRARTFQHDAAFERAVPQDKLVRLLNAFVHHAEEEDIPYGYVQALNLIAGMFLYVMPEPDAFACYCTVLRNHLPLYYNKNLTGAHNGLKMMVCALKVVDPELYAHLHAFRFQPEVLLHPVLSVGCATPPMQEALHVWDYLIAFGMHLGPLVATAQLVLMRDMLLHHHSPCSTFRVLPRLDAGPIVRLVNLFVAQLPDDLFDLLVRHVHDPNWKLPDHLAGETLPDRVTSTVIDSS